MIARLAVVAGLGAASVAHAEPRAGAHGTGAPDPAVEQAGDANLESTANRQGLTFAASIGGGVVVGFGIEGSVGRAGAVNLRLGHVATPHTVITFELDASAVLHKPATHESTETNSNVNLLAGAQYYVNPSLWLRVAGGLGVYAANQVPGERDPMQPNTPVLVDRRWMGPAVLGGIGLELARFKWAVICLEAGTSAMINGDGLLVASDLRLGLSFD
ncbi:MAG TPA: hypothetical protein VK607_01680 [Kofleriaceae bacterium]|nr:hypothetical protein [Kofleriaceae bacterium]